MDKKPPIITPNTKVNSLVSAADKETIKKKLLFSEVVTQQLNENFSKITTNQEKSLILKSLSCFCDSELCRHFQLGTLDYPQTHAKFRLHVDDIYGASDSDDEPLIQIACQKRMKKPQEIQLSVPTTSNNNQTAQRRSKALNIWEKKHLTIGTLCWLNFKIEKQNIVKCCNVHRC
ncbi:hypothetical protein WA026_020207 [Henosepilachna vigintioctopunctata]|uniref:Uncharacterized protein n=1 Tax=Henosepilachna vigintioctopunctata TaxID=420089 RepID=A0AAW1UA94_9CUCU